MDLEQQADHVPGQLGLFPAPPPVLQLVMPLAPPAPPAEQPRSPDARRTARQRTLVAQGWHPLTRGRAHPEAGTCGDCPHRQLRGRGGRSYAKCELGPATRGPATDVRAWWPACHRHPEHQPDGQERQ